MRNGLVFLTALVCASGTARAEDRYVVIDAADANAVDLIRPRLATLSDLRPLEVTPSADASSEQSLESAVKKPRADFEAAQAAFDSAAGRNALTMWENALLALPPSPERTVALADFHIERGAFLAGSGNRTAAVDAFRLAKRLDPTRTTLPPARFRPKLVRLFEKTKPTTETASVSFETVPGGARVFVDGAPRGETPLRLDVAAGEHVITFRAVGFQTQSERLGTEASGSQQRIERTLTAGSAAELLKELEASVARGEMAPDRAARTAGARLQVKASVVVWRSGGGAIAATYDQNGALLSGPVALALLDSLLAPLMREAKKSETVLLSEEPAAEARPWYRTWWGISLLVGGAAAIATGTTLWLTIDRDSDPTGFQIGGFQCAPGVCP